MSSSLINIYGLNFKKAQYLSFTQEAIKQITTLLSAKQQKEADVVGVLITLKQKGCAGLAYKIEYAKTGVNIFDKYEIIQHANFNLFINPKIALYLIGTQMDFQNDRLKSGFIFINPNSKGECGCGESFFV